MENIRMGSHCRFDIKYRKQSWKCHLLARGNFVATSGTVADDVIREYIRLQDEPPSDVDHFKIL